jgi:hypothetical protein
MLLRRNESQCLLLRLIFHCINVFAILAVSSTEKLGVDTIPERPKNSLPTHIREVDLLHDRRCCRAIARQSLRSSSLSSQNRCRIDLAPLLPAQNVRCCLVLKAPLFHSIHASAYVGLL